MKPEKIKENKEKFILVITNDTLCLANAENDVLKYCPKNIIKKFLCFCMCLYVQIKNQPPHTGAKADKKSGCQFTKYHCGIISSASI